MAYYFFARHNLKKTIIFITLALGLAAMTWAQGWGRRWDSPNTPPQPAVETVTVSGSLIVSHGMPALTSGDVTYLIMGVNHLVGFIDGFKEGAQVSIEGSAIGRDGSLKYLRPVKMILGGKTYDLSSPINFQNFRNQIPPQNYRFPVPPPNNRQPGQPMPNPPQGRQRQRSL